LVTPLFRVQRLPSSTDGNRLLGYEWIEVLAIEPWALGHPDDQYGPWCDRVIRCQYICLTPDGLMRITSDDFWAALDDYQEYDPTSPNKPEAQYVITAGDASVVQVGTTTHGDIRTTRDRYSARMVGAQGPGAQGSVNTLLPVGASLADLHRELAELRSVLRRQATDVSQDLVVAAVGEAEVAIADGDERGAREALKRAGRWALNAAQEVGLQVAAAAIAHGIGS
jgi:hypothetical protein